MQRYIAVYDSLARARDVIDELIKAGHPAEDISLVAYDVDEEYAPYLSESAEEYEAYLEDQAYDPEADVERRPRAEREAGADDDVTEGAGVGALIGGLGGLLIGLSALMIPGVGPILAAGPLATALAGGAVGAAGGAAAGALVDTLVDQGIDRPYAEYYAESVRRGGAMITVETDDVSPQTEEILKAHRPIDLERRMEEWRDGGWQSTEAEEPYRPERRYEREYYYSDDPDERTGPNS